MTEEHCRLAVLPLVALWVGSFVAAVVGAEILYRLTGRPKP